MIYTGPATLQNVISSDIYTHFLLLSCGIRALMCGTSSDEDITFAEQALKKFVILSEYFYGLQFMSYNMHGLLHLANDVRLLGKLDSFFAFDFENYMPEFRKFIRKPHLQLQQFIRRLNELKICMLYLQDPLFLMIQFFHLVLTERSSST